MIERRPDDPIQQPEQVNVALAEYIARSGVTYERSEPEPKLPLEEGNHFA